MSTLDRNRALNKAAIDKVADELGKGAEWPPWCEWCGVRHDPITPAQLRILQHSLGLDEYGRGTMYRNHFCAGADDEPTCRELVSAGFMAAFQREWLPYYNCLVTDAGKRAVLVHRQHAPKLTRSQRRYREFMDADSGRSFIEWLRDRRHA